MKRDVRIIALLVLAVGIVYAQVGHHEFGQSDDAEYVTQNPHVRAGLTWEGVRWAFTTGAAGNWHPVTWLSHMLDSQLFGVEGRVLGIASAGWHHLVSAVLHALNAALLYLVFRRMTGAPWRSAVVAGLFALHPAHVESVAWAAERKDVLSAFFGILAIGAYAWYARRPGIPRYLAVVLLTILGVMAKPMLVTLPLLLLLMDVWPLERLREPTARDVARLLLEKLPLLVLAIASSLVTLRVQRSAGMMAPAGSLPLLLRFENALVSYVAYVRTAVWPTGLSAFYPYPYEIPLWKGTGAAVLLLAATALVLRTRRRYLAVGWLWYVGMLVPVIGIVPVGLQSMADRYTYLPFVGLFVMAVWGAAELAPRWRVGPSVLAAVACATLLGCISLAHRQAGYWRDPVTLYAHAAEVTPNNEYVRNVLARALAAQKEKESLEGLRDALRGHPRDAHDHIELGRAHLGLGQVDEAVAQFEKAIEIDPGSVEGHGNLAVALASRRDYEGAAHQLREVLRLDAGSFDARFHLAGILEATGKREEAAGEYRKALEIAPGDFRARSNLATVLLEDGRLEEAIAEYREALKTRPESATLCFNLAQALERAEHYDEAIARYRDALRLDPRDTNSGGHLAALLAREGRFAEAAATAEAAARAATESGARESAGELRRRANRYRAGRQP
ncbi:MAG: tetratricopeptide repeat protein [Acidobacteriia bacterium]|nr:tetratricopeptide repeat protein [Terriglobia bacterium]